jgi:DNA-binding response OmpR family regulator
MAHVLLYEPDPALSALLTNFLADDGFDITQCASLADIQAAADEHPDATVVLDSSWADYGNADLGETEREVLNDLSQRTTVIVTTARLWPYKLSRLSLAPSVTVVPKPYDVEELLAIVRERTPSAQFRAQELSRCARN